MQSSLEHCPCRQVDSQYEETLRHQLENSKHCKLSGNRAFLKQEEACREQWLAAVLQSEDDDQVGSG